MKRVSRIRIFFFLRGLMFLKLCFHDTVLDSIIVTCSERVRHGDTISLKMFTAAMEEIYFKDADLQDREKKKKHRWREVN